MKNMNSFEAKDVKRIADIMWKANGNMDKAIRLTTNMANAITKADKALRRATVARIAGQDRLAQIFQNRYEFLTTQGNLF